MPWSQRLFLSLSPWALLLLAWTGAAHAAGAPPDAPIASAILADMPQAEVKQPKVTATLLTDRAAWIPGQGARVGLRLTFAPGHYIYGLAAAATVTEDTSTTAAGIPTAFTLTSPPGFQVEHLPWPAPKRVEKPLSATHTEDLFIYDGAALFDARVLVPASAVIGEHATVTAKASWLLCEKTCQPGEVEVSLTLPIASAEGAVIDPAWSQLFSLADAARPLLTPPEGFQLSTVLTQQPARPGDRLAVVVTLTPPPGVTLAAPQDPDRAVASLDRPSDSLHARRATSQILSDGRLRAVIPLFADEYLEGSPTPIPLAGLLQADVAGDPSGRASIALAFSASLPVTADVAAPITLLEEAADLDAVLAATQAPTPPNALTAPVREKLPLWQALLFAFLGGVILNIMPCVLPVLSLKSLAIVELAKETQSGVQKHVAAYALGVLSSFWVLAAVIIAFKQSGEAVGWGFQFQNPAFVTVIAAVVWASALSLFGVFELPGLSIEVGEGHKGGVATSFSHGLLATLLSTPCSAPLLGTALAFALAQPSPIIALTLTMVGLGLASPVMVLAIVPASRKLLPRPGAWMDTFKQTVAFLMVATCLWLLDVLAAMISARGLISVLILLAAISAAAWAWGRFATILASTRKKAITGLIAITLISAASWRLALDDASSQGVSLESERITWRPFQGDDTIAMASQGHTVFIDFTAAWCLSCKAFENTVIETDAVAHLLSQNNVLSFKADWTRKDASVTKWLNHFGGVAVPLYVVLPANNPQSPIIIADSITQSQLLNALSSAGPSTLPPPSTPPAIVQPTPAYCANGKPC
jgi:thiol:disulfide interchange protein/DsbC/DsbD-like thiol-disulfide interchange protein